LADYFEEATRAHGKPKIVANWILNELLRELPGDDDAAVAASPVPPVHLVGLLALIDDGSISGRIAKDVFEKMYRSGEAADTIVRREGLTQVADAESSPRWSMRCSRPIPRSWPICWRARRPRMASSSGR
jgi:aspartyl-tRNA(Asn)/glutamyl-tRNA(Gln) amidotransferase subunit B